MPGQPRFIQTLPKRGYCFVAPVSEHEGDARDAGVGGDGSASKGRSIVGREEESELLAGGGEAGRSADSGG